MDQSSRRTEAPEKPEKNEKQKDTRKERNMFAEYVYYFVVYERTLLQPASNGWA